MMVTTTHLVYWLQKLMIIQRPLKSMKVLKQYLVVLKEHLTVRVMILLRLLDGFRNMQLIQTASNGHHQMVGMLI